MKRYEELDRETLEKLLAQAHLVITWTTQDTLRKDAAGIRHLLKAREDYYKARVDALAKVRPLNSLDLGPGSNYQYGAGLQPWNHRIPWNCPSYYDGCNCEGGPYYDFPEEKNEDLLFLVKSRETAPPARTGRLPIAEMGELRG